MKKPILISKQEIQEYLRNHFVNVKDLEPIFFNNEQEHSFRVHKVFTIKNCPFQVCTYETEPEVFQRVLIAAGFNIFTF